LTNRDDTEYVLKDYGPQPLALDIEKATEQNRTFRTALWTGRHLQVTLMSISVGEDIGVEIHPELDQFLRIEQGQGIVQMGYSRDNMNLTNTGNIPLKLYSIYAPPQHPRGTVHVTRADAIAAERNH
jgi:mannose-6-phosphate isomerase-like protein (cupin superfamily)